MMKKLFKPLAFFLVLAMLSQIIVIGSVSASDSGSCGSGVSYYFDSYTGILTLSGYGSTDDFEEFTQSKARSIDDDEGWSPIWRPGSGGSSGTTPEPKYVPWKDYVDFITEVVVEEGVYGIGDNAFSQCYYIEKITFYSPDTILSASAFNLDYQSYEIHLYKNSVADEYFSSDAHTKIYFEDAGGDDPVVPSEGDFSYVINNGEVTITSYTGSASNVEILSKIEGLPVTVIENYAFENCGYITEIVIPNSVETIGEGAFSGCSSLEEVTIGNGVSSIGNYAFHSCGSLTSLTIKTKDAEIGKRIVDGCDVLERVYLYENSTADEYFSADLYTKIYLSEEEELPESNFEYTVNNETKTATITGYKGTDTELVIPSVIGEYTVTTIASFSFEEIYDIVNVVIPDSVTVIEEMVFSNCSNLISVSFGNGITTIGDRAFQNCENLGNVILPASVSSLGKEPFFNCLSIEKIEVDENNEYFCDLDGVLFTKDMETVIHYPVGNDASEYVIPDETKNIGACAFYRAYNLSNITIPSSVETIDRFAFFDCVNLESIDIPSNVEIISASAFAFCSALTSVTVPDGVTSINGRAFAGCYSMTEITIPASVTSIEDDSFVDCSALETIYLYHGSTADEYFSEDEYTKVYLDDEEATDFGDINCDGDVDVKDIVLFAQYLADWNVEIEENSADCNCDGTLNTKDIVLLAQYLAGWDVTLG